MDWTLDWMCEPSDNDMYPTAIGHRLEAPENVPYGCVHSDKECRERPEQLALKSSFCTLEPDQEGSAYGPVYYAVGPQERARLYPLNPPSPSSKDLISRECEAPSNSNYPTLSTLDPQEAQECTGPSSPNMPIFVTLESQSHAPCPILETHAIPPESYRFHETEPFIQIVREAQDVDQGEMVCAVRRDSCPGSSGNSPHDTAHVHSEFLDSGSYPCPYFIHAPEEHSECKFWHSNDLSRVKEHIHRKHLRLLYCERCWAFRAGDHGQIKRHQKRCSRASNPSALALRNAEAGRKISRLLKQSNTWARMCEGLFAVQPVYGAGPAVLNRRELSDATSSPATTISPSSSEEPAQNEVEPENVCVTGTACRDFQTEDGAENTRLAEIARLLMELMRGAYDSEDGRSINLNITIVENAQEGASGNGAYNMKFTVQALDVVPPNHEFSHSPETHLLEATGQDSPALETSAMLFDSMTVEHGAHYAALESPNEYEELFYASAQPLADTPYLMDSEWDDLFSGLEALG